MHPITRLALGFVLIALAWKLERQKSKLDGADPRPSEAPWPSSRSILSDQTIRSRLPAADWFTATDVARALQNAPPGRKPSGSAGRAARTLVGRWVREGFVELQYFGPSGRPFYRVISDPE